jgi:hypothetical protein
MYYMPTYKEDYNHYTWVSIESGHSIRTKAGFVKNPQPPVKLTCLRYSKFCGNNEWDACEAFLEEIKADVARVEKGETVVLQTPHGGIGEYFGNKRKEG